MSISKFERSKRMFKIRPPELDQLVKLSKRSSLTYQEKTFRKYSFQRMRWSVNK